MATITPDYIRGLLIPLANISKDNLWAAQSTYTEQNPRAGVPKAQQNSRGLVVQCAGEQSQDITIYTQDGGTPGGSVGTSATFVWEDDKAVRYGKNHANMVSDWKYFAFTNTPGNSFNDFDAISTDDGSLYVVTEQINGTIYTITCRKQTRDGSISTIKTFLTTTLSSSPNTTAKPSICQLKDGSILVSYFDYTSADSVNLFVWRTYDEGATWEQISKRALDYPIYVKATDGYLIEKTSMVVVDDTVVLAVAYSSRITTLGDNTLFQFVSRDSGTTFRGIGYNGSDTFHQATAVTLPMGQVGFAYISATDTLSFLSIPHPGITAGNPDYQALKEVTVSSGVYTFATATNDVLFNGELTTWYDDGVLYIVAKDQNEVVYGWMSRDYGESWEYINQTINAGIFPPYVFNQQSSVSLDNFKSCVWEGRYILLTRTFNSIGMLYLGGWSDWTMLETSTQPDRGEYHTWHNGWVHNQTPDTSSAYTTTGTGAHAIIQTGLQISTGSTTNRYYTFGGGLSPEQSYLFKMKVTTGNDFSATRIAVRNRWDDGTYFYTMSIRFGTSGFQVYDYTGSIHTENITLTNLHEFAIFHNNGDVIIKYRPWDEKQAKTWTEITLSIGTQPTGTGTSVLEWGHITSPLSGTFESIWSDFHISKQFVGEPAKTLRGSSYPSSTEYTYIDEGLLLTAKESPARAGESFFVEARADYPIEHVFHDVALSPRIQWRSVDDSSTERIAWYADPNVPSTAKTLGLSDMGGIHLSGINWKTANFRVWNGAGWTTLATIDTSTGLQSTFVRNGATLSAGGSVTPFNLFYDEARGWRAELENGGTKYIVPILQNSEGIWDASNKYKQCVLTIDTSKVDVSVLPTSGNIALMPTSVTLINELYQNAVGAGQSAYAIEIPTQDTLEGWYEIGTMLQGNMYIMAPQYQKGRTITMEPNIQSVETLDGIYWARKMSEGKRTFSVAWTEPVDSSRIFSLAPDVWKFSTSANTQPVANYGDAPFAMLGLCKYLANITPVVYLPSITPSTGSTDVQIYNRYHTQVLARTTGAVSMESVLGEESHTEAFRVATINLVEVE